MLSVENLKINLQAAYENGEPLVFRLGDDFFSALDQDEIKGGDLEVSLRIEKKAASVYQIGYAISGTVKTTCDRCLDDLVLPVEGEDTVRVCTDAPVGDDDGETKYLQDATGRYDTAWDIYELAELSLPTGRYHAEGECNAEMLEKLHAYMPAQ